MTGVYGVAERRLHDKWCRRQRWWQRSFGVALHTALQWWVKGYALALLPQTFRFSLLASFLLLEGMLILRVHRPEGTLALLVWTALNLLECAARGEVVPDRTLHRGQRVG